LDLFDNVNNLGNFSNIIVLGDFNTQHSNWGSTSNNFTGITFSEFLMQSPYIVVNDGTGTRVSTNINRVSCPDVTLIKTNSLAFSWAVGEDPIRSDHLPIELSISSRGNTLSNEQYGSKRPKLSLNKLDKNLFVSLVITYG